MMRSFKFTQFAILKFDVSSKPKIQFQEESWMAIQYTDIEHTIIMCYSVAVEEKSIQSNLSILGPSKL